MKEVLIILGAGVMQGPAIRIAKELGYFTIALDGSSAAPCVSMADQFEQIDLKDKEGIETFAHSVQKTAKRLGIMTAGTDFSASVAWTAERLGLPGIPYEAALNASDKSRMRECFKNASLPSPDFFTVTEDSSFDSVLLPFPVVIKPVDNMGARGCRRVDSIEEYPQAAKTAINFSRTRRAIVENFMDGSEFSVDAIVYHGEITICGLADRHIFFPPYFIEMGHTMPTVIEEEKQAAMLETFRAGIRALGLAEKENIGAAKGDIKLTEKGPMIGEIAARLSGGYMSGWTYPYSSGVEPIRAAILAAMGCKPDNLNSAKNWTCAERAFISIPGTVKEIAGIEKARSLPCVNDLFLRIQKGDKVSFPENNVTKCGNIIASAPRREEAVKAAETAARSILIRLDPLDKETASFLHYSQKYFTAESASNLRFADAEGFKIRERLFPPDAFEVSDEIREILFKIPDFTGTGEDLFIYPFPALTTSNLTDYMGRTAEEALEAVRFLTGLPLREASKNADNKNILGRSFWKAFIRGSYQGAVYFIEGKMKNEKGREG